MRHHNETCARHICAGRAKHVVDLDLTVARADPHHDGGTGRAAGAPGGPEIGEPAPEGITIRELIAVSRHCVKTLRGQEGPVDSGDIRRRFRR